MHQEYISTYTYEKVNDQKTNMDWKMFQTIVDNKQMLDYDKNVEYGTLYL